MDINATLLGQMLTFALLVWVTMKYIWPPLLGALDERQRKIAAGLQAAEESKSKLAETFVKIEAQLAEARNESNALVKQAMHRAEQIIEEAKLTAKNEQQRIVTQAQSDIKQEIEKAKTDLLKEAVDISIQCAERILQKNLSMETDKIFLNKLIQDIADAKTQ